MRQLYFVSKGKLEWRDSAEPELTEETDAIVRPLAAARCDLDNAFLLHDSGPAVRAGLALHFLDPLVRDTFGVPPFKGPFPYGHECMAEVIRAGPSVTGFAPGDRVVVPFQLSCGHCAPCRRALTAHCSTGRTTPIRAFGFGNATGGLGGMVTDLLRVPNAGHMLVKAPKNVPATTLASASDNIADGWRTVARHLRSWPGTPVLILGGRAKSVSLYAAASAIALGSGRVDYVDTSRERLAIAERLGANAIQAGRGGYRQLAGSGMLLPGGYLVTVDGNGAGGALDFALRSLAPGGVCTSVAFYLRRGTPVPLWHMYVYGGTLTTGLANVRADLPDILAAVADGRMRPELVTTRLAYWTDAPEALLDPGTKVVLYRSEGADL